MTGAARLESIAQVGILLIMGGMAGAASFTHIHDLTVAHGQPSWIGWANAIVVDLMSIAAGLDSRRRKRTGQSTRFVHTVLFAAAAVSLAAQVAEAEPSVWGWLVAALPALGFLAVVEIVLTRTPVMSGPDRSGHDEVGPVEPVDRSMDVDVRRHEVTPADSSLAEPVRSETAGEPDGTKRWDVGRAVEELIVPVQRIDGHQNGGPGASRTDDEDPRSRFGPIETWTGPDRSESDLSGLRPVRSGHDEVGPVETAVRSADLDIGPVEPADRSTDVDARTHEVTPADSSLAEPAWSETTGEPDDTKRWDADRAVEELIVPVQRIDGHQDGSPGASRTDDEDPRSRSGPIETWTGLDDDLLELGKTIAVKVAMRNGKLTRQVLIDEIRSEGRTIGTDRASDLLRWIKMEEAASVGTD